MKVELFMVHGFGESPEERRAEDGTDCLPCFEMAPPPLVGDVVEWEIEERADGSTWFLTGLITSRAFHLGRGISGVTCRLTVVLLDDDAVRARDHEAMAVSRR